MRDLSKEHAAKIYKIEYWDATFGDEIAFQPLADILFEFYVNAGHHAIVGWSGTWRRGDSPDRN